jgi:hypothetical protein
MDKNSKLSGTDRRSFLKTGALVTAPLAAVALPAAALAADDGSRAKLARLEDERAIEGLRRSVLRKINGDAASDCGQFIARADAIELDEGLRSIADDPVEEPTLALSEDGAHATCRNSCRVEVETALTGSTTLERMARFQGQGSHRSSEKRMLLTDYVKQDGEWKLAHLRLA